MSARVNMPLRDTITALAAGGLLASEIGERVGLTAKQIRDYARHAGISITRHPNYERRVNISELAQLAAAQKTTSEISKIMGFCQTSIARAARDNKIALHPDARSVVSAQWQKNNAALKAMLNAGKTLTEMAAALGVTRSAIAGRLYRIGLTTPRKAPRPIVEFPPPGRCVFPFGDPGKPDFSFCGEHAEPSGPYCYGHHRRCYRPNSLLELAE